MVYRGLDVLSPRKLYAIKCMVKADSGSRHSVFQERELTLQALVCDHPNIVHLHEILSDDHHIYAVMQYCEEGDLFSAIVDRQVYIHRDGLIKAAIVQLIDAVTYCHSLAIFHRDIKPENVMCASKGTRVFLGDFGLATTTPVSSDFCCGSRYYMSPGEQLLPYIDCRKMPLMQSPHRMHQRRTPPHMLFTARERPVVFRNHPIQSRLHAQSMAVRNDGGQQLLHVLTRSFVLPTHPSALERGKPDSTFHLRPQSYRSYMHLGLAQTDRRLTDILHEGWRGTHS